MRTFELLEIIARNPAHLDDYKECADSVDEAAGTLSLDTRGDCWKSMIRKHLASPSLPEGFNKPSPPEPFVPSPPKEWPMLARIIRRMRSTEDRGVGDTVARMLSYFGAKSMSEMYERIMGKPCGCGDRQARLNAFFPYAVTAS